MLLLSRGGGGRAVERRRFVWQTELILGDGDCGGKVKGDEGQRVLNISVRISCGKKLFD